MFSLNLFIFTLVKFQEASKYDTLIFYPRSELIEKWKKSYLEENLNFITNETEILEVAWVLGQNEFPNSDCTPSLDWLVMGKSAPSCLFLLGTLHARGLLSSL